MQIKLKPLDEQVIVITGATSGIGIVTARLAAARGARLMLVSREETALTELVRKLSRDAKDGVAHTVADVGDRKQLQAAADAAIQRFGGFDTWINDAGVLLDGRCERRAARRAKQAL